MSALIVDQKRLDDGILNNYDTAIIVRAKFPDGSYGAIDISALDKNSLLEWLRSRGGCNPWAEDVVGILLGHGHLHDRVQVITEITEET
jgi:hypothetical protein